MLATLKAEETRVDSLIAEVEKLKEENTKEKK